MGTCVSGYRELKGSFRVRGHQRRRFFAALRTKLVAEHVQQRSSLGTPRDRNVALGGPCHGGQLFRLVYISGQENQKLRGTTSIAPSDIALHINIARQQWNHFFW